MDNDGISKQNTMKNKLKSYFIKQNKNFIHLKNVGGVAKNVIVETEVIWTRMDSKIIIKELYLKFISEK
ncbi:hypothetical protein [Mammaliicoccus sciuri]|uniref:hypothetical protein n=1 Tax=Mammaliicoccus sciuri TaxID=1296 RepID=UPI001E407946|nr:hypothetical protein [Mammaliicoccus sciuri]MCD8898581.1 hypothetical protein [Mammaliicoccus sciuri]